MPITKSRTRRELVETVFERGKHRPLILEIWDGVAYIFPKGLPRQRTQVSLAGSFRHAQMVAAAVPTLKDAKQRRKMDPERAAKAHMPTDPMMRALLGPRACGVAV